MSTCGARALADGHPRLLGKHRQLLASLGDDILGLVLPDQPVSALASQQLVFRFQLGQLAAKILDVVCVELGLGVCILDPLTVREARRDNPIFG